MQHPGNWIDHIEMAAMNAWPAWQQVIVDGWMLRLAGGYTKRANSANYLYAGTLPAETFVKRSEAIYRAQAMPPLFRIVERPECEPVDQLLAEKGYRIFDTSLVMRSSLEDFEAAIGNQSALSGEVRFLPLDAWLPHYYALSGSRLETQAAHRRILQQMILPHRLATVVDRDAQVVAVGVSVVDGDLAGYFDVVTHPAQRRKGYGTALMAGLTRWARSEGARQLYLQVVEANTTARRLYEKLGFRIAYRYWYRVPSE